MPPAERTAARSSRRRGAAPARRPRGGSRRAPVARPAVRRRGRRRRREREELSRRRVDRRRKGEERVERARGGAAGGERRERRGAAAAAGVERHRGLRRGAEHPGDRVERRVAHGDEERRDSPAVSRRSSGTDRPPSSVASAPLAAGPRPVTDTSVASCRVSQRARLAPTRPGPTREKRSSRSDRVDIGALRYGRDASDATADSANPCNLKIFALTRRCAGRYNGRNDGGRDVAGSVSPGAPCRRRHARTPQRPAAQSAGSRDPEGHRADLHPFRRAGQLAGGGQARATRPLGGEHPQRHGRPREDSGCSSSPTPRPGACRAAPGTTCTSKA